MRQPKFQGTGYIVLANLPNLITGDTAFDSDYGYIEWDGTQWISIEPQEPCDKHGSFHGSTCPDCKISFMKAEELFAIANEIDSKMNNWVRQQDIVAQRILYYRTLKNAYELKGSAYHVALYQYILKHHNMRTRVEVWQMNYYSQVIDQS